MKRGPTLSDWAQAVEELRTASHSRPPDVLTTSEIAAANGWSRTKTREYIRKLIALGRIEVSRVYAPVKPGFSKPMPAYRLLKEASHAVRPVDRDDARRDSGKGSGSRHRRLVSPKGKK